MWFVELAIRYARDLLDRAEDNRVYTLEDLGIRRYQISPEWDAEEARLGPFRNEWDEFEMIERILRWRAEHERRASVVIRKWLGVCGPPWRGSRRRS